MNYISKIIAIWYVTPCILVAATLLRDYTALRKSVTDSIETSALKNSSVLKMNAIRPFERLAVKFYQNTLRHIPQDRGSHTLCRKNLKSQKLRKKHCY
jgi:hypothetical protein